MAEKPNAVTQGLDKPALENSEFEIPEHCLVLNELVNNLEAQLIQDTHSMQSVSLQLFQKIERLNIEKKQTTEQIKVLAAIPHALLQRVEAFLPSEGIPTIRIQEAPSSESAVIRSVLIPGNANSSEPAVSTIIQTNTVQDSTVVEKPRLTGTIKSTPKLS